MTFLRLVRGDASGLTVSNWFETGDDVVLKEEMTGYLAED